MQYTETYDYRMKFLGHSKERIANELAEELLALHEKSKTGFTPEMVKELDTIKGKMEYLKAL